MTACSNMPLLADFSTKLHAQGATQLSRYTIQVTQVSKNMEAGLVTSSYKMSLLLDYFPCHSLSTYVVLGK